MLIADARTPVTWTAPNQPKAVPRLMRKLERDAPRPVDDSVAPGRERRNNRRVACENLPKPDSRKSR
jgi:hypothetical protein